MVSWCRWPGTGMVGLGEDLKERKMDACHVRVASLGGRSEREVTGGDANVGDDAVQDGN